MPSSIPSNPLNSPSSTDQNFLACFEKNSIEELTQKLDEIKKNPIYQKYLDFQKIELRYSDKIPLFQRLRAVVFVALVISSLIIISCILSSQNFLNFFHHINYIKLAIGIGIPLILITGAGIVIYRAIHKTEALLGKHHLKAVTYSNEDVQKTTFLRTGEATPTEVMAENTCDQKDVKTPKRGAFVHMEKHLETVMVKCEVWKEGDTDDCYVDMSTVDESGKALMYSIKSCFNHYYVGARVILATPIYTIACVIYNLLRTVVVPFYILVQLLREKYTGKRIYTEENERAFELADIPKEMGKSIWRAVKAPFFGLAYLFAAFYSFANPMGGRKLGAAIERDWDEGVTVAEGYWSIVGPMKFWKFEGGGGPNKLGRNGFYITGCWQPSGYVIFDKNMKVIAAYRMETVIIAKNPQGKLAKEKPLEVIFLKDLENIDLEQGKQLQAEAKAIKKQLKTMKEK